MTAETAPTTPSPRQNHVLGVLPADTYKRLFPYLEPVSLARGEVLYEFGRRLSHVYFPTDAIVSLMYVTESGASSEISLVGNDGLV